MAALNGASSPTTSRCASRTRASCWSSRVGPSCGAARRRPSATDATGWCCRGWRSTPGARRACRASPLRRPRPRSQRRTPRPHASLGSMERRARRSEPEPVPGLFDAPVPAPAAPPPRSPAPAPAPARAEPAPPPLFTVGELSGVIQGRLAELGRIRVEGEVSQKKRASAGHVYFDLKEEGARLACKIWQSVVSRALRFELTEGARVVVWGRLDVYAPQG